MKHINLIMSVFLGFCIIFTGCSSIQNMINKYSDSKEQCLLNDNNITQFEFDGKSYTILEDAVTEKSLGEWVGYIRKMAATDDSGAVLIQENIESTSFRSLADLSEKSPNAKYIVPFLNIYSSSEYEGYLLVDVKGSYHKAVLSDEITEADIIFDFKTATDNINSNYKLNPENATQLISDDVIYQVTDEKISDEKLGKYIDFLAERVVFNAETKKALTNDDLNKIDWTGTSDEKRESWFYADVYEISGIDTAEAIAVKVNNQYYIARSE